MQNCSSVEVLRFLRALLDAGGSIFRRPFFDPEVQNMYAKSAKMPRPDFCVFCVRFLTLPRPFSKVVFPAGSPKLVHKKHKNTQHLIFVFFVYEFWAWRSHFRQVVFLVEGRKSAHKTHKTPDTEVLWVLWTEFTVSGSNLGVRHNPSVGNFGE